MVLAASLMPSRRTCPSGTSTASSSPATAPSTLPPDSAARSTTTLPGFMPASMPAVTSSGARRPGTAAVVISTSAAATCGASSSCWRTARSADSSRAYPPAPSTASSSRSTKVPPIERTSSALAGRTSYADTTAPSRLAVAIACSPATPAPSTSTRAGGTVPAAVMNSGKKRGSRVAASSTQRYPATSACEVSASIDWARLIRGTSSMANAVTWACARARTTSSSAPGEQKPRVTAPGLSLATTSGRSGRTCRSTSTPAASTVSTTSAPAAA